MKISDRLEALAEKATKGPWLHYDEVFRPQFSNRRITEIQQRRTRKPVVNWQGFDGDQKKLANKNAALIVELVNNLPTILQALKDKEL